MRRWKTALPLAIVLFILLPAAVAAAVPDPCGVIQWGAITVPDIGCGNKPNLPEAYPSWSYTMYSNYGLDPVSNTVHPPVNELASLAFVLIAMIGSLVLLLLELAFTLNLVDLLAPLSSSGAGALMEHIYFPLLGIAALVLVAYGIKSLHHGRHGEVGQNMLYAVLAMLMAAFFAVNPTFVPSMLDSLRSEISLAGMGAVAQVDPNVQAARNSDQYSRGIDQHSDYAGLRLFADEYWRGFVYTPWAAATFGGADTGKVCYQDKPDEGIGGWISGVFGGGSQQTGEVTGVVDPKCPHGTLADVTLASNAAGKTSGSLENQVDAANHNGMYFKGNSPELRLIDGIFALLAILISAAVLGRLAVTVLVCQLGMLLLAALMPIFFLLGITPPGQRLLVKVWRMMFSFALVGAGLAIILAVLLLISGGLAQIVNGGPFWLAASILQIALMVAAWLLSRPLLHLFSSAVGADHLALNISQLGRAKVHGKEAARRQALLDEAKATDASATAPSGSAGTKPGRVISTGSRSAAPGVAARKGMNLLSKLATKRIATTGPATAVGAGSATAAAGGAGAAGTVATGGLLAAGAAVVAAGVVAYKGVKAVRKAGHSAEGAVWRLVDPHLSANHKPEVGSVPKNGSRKGHPPIKATRPVRSPLPAGNGTGHRPAAPRPNAIGGVELVGPDGQLIRPSGMRAKAAVARKQIILTGPQTRNPRGARE